MQGQKRKGQVDEQLSEIIDVPAAGHDPAGDEFSRFYFQQGVLIHVGGKMEKDAKTKHGSAQTRKPRRCRNGQPPVEKTGIDDPGRGPVQGEPKPHVEPVPDTGMLFPGFIRKDAAFQHPQDTVGPMEGQISPGGGIRPGAVDLHQKQDKEPRHALVDIDKIFFLEFQGHGRGLSRKIINASRLKKSSMRRYSRSTALTE